MFRNETSFKNLIFFFELGKFFNVDCVIWFQFLSAVMLKDYETALKYCKLSKSNNNFLIYAFSLDWKIGQFQGYK